jgi:Holliday junction resolvase RusA-like endonuclease
MRWIALDVNPEPWAIGPVGYSRRGGKMSAYVGRNQQLDAYKEAIREALGEQPKLDGKVTLVFYFWRNRAEYLTAQARTHRKHEADVTNLQKATEDACQGVLFDNDRDVACVYSEMREQGPDVIPAVVIGIDSYIETELPPQVIALLDKSQQALPFDDDSARWIPGQDVF